MTGSLEIWKQRLSHLEKTFNIKTCRIDIRFWIQNRYKVLDNIINSQRPLHDKFGLGYNQTERGLSSKATDQERYPRIYVETVRADKKFYKEDHGDTPPPRRFKFQNQ
jgi:hypothetical protein